MEKLVMCRICLATDLRMDSIVNSPLQDTYERLTMKQFETKDSRPIMACYLCCARLQNCYQLSMNCLQSEELLTQMLSGIQVNSTNLQEITRNMRLGTTPVVVETFGDALIYDIDGNVKMEPYTQSSDVEVEVKMVINKVVEDSMPERSIEEEPASDDGFQDPEDEVPLDIIKHEPGSMAPSAPVSKQPALTTQTNLKHAKKQIGEPKTDAEIALGDKTLENNILQTHSERDYELRKFDKSHSISDQNNIEKAISRSNFGKKLKPYSCNNCRKCFSSKYSLVKHLRIHTGEKPYHCNICKKCFRRKDYLDTHIRSHSGEKPYQCNICKKCFSRKCYLDVHIRTHTGEKPYRCNICTKCFKIKSNLDDHTRTHTGEKPYQCNICKKYFSRKNYLDIHIRTHTGEKPYRCNVCSKCFTLKSSLVIHIRTHTGEKPYQCNICKERFNSKFKLNQHIRKHTGEKPYQCNVCKKCFILKSYLDIHSRTHTGEKPYRCNVCTKCFSRKYYLDIHIYRHTGKEPHQCNVCKKYFTENCKLVKHMRIHTSVKQ